MSDVSIVVGLHYGDEGKGITVSNIIHNQLGTHRSPPLIARFNGGAQAGHTVKYDKPPQCHVHQHYGSGALAGCETLLTRFFVVNPILFFYEASVLKLV